MLYGYFLCRFLPFEIISTPHYYAVFYTYIIPYYGCFGKFFCKKWPLTLTLSAVWAETPLGFGCFMLVGGKEKIQNGQTKSESVRHNPRYFLCFSSVTEINRLYAVAPLLSKAVAFDKKAKQVLKAMLILLNQLSAVRLVSPPERRSLFVAKRHKFRKIEYNEIFLPIN